MLYQYHSFGCFLQNQRQAIHSSMTASYKWLTMVAQRILRFSNFTFRDSYDIIKQDGRNSRREHTHPGETVCFGFKLIIRGYFRLYHLQLVFFIYIPFIILPIIYEFSIFCVRPVLLLRLGLCLTGCSRIASNIQVGWSLSFHRKRKISPRIFLLQRRDNYLRTLPNSAALTGNMP